MTNSFIEKKVEELEKTSYDILGLEVDPHGTDHMLLTKDEDGNVLEGVSFFDEVQELKSFLRSALRDYAAYLKEAIRMKYIIMGAQGGSVDEEANRKASENMLKCEGYNQALYAIVALLDKEIKEYK